jgi:Xaa-Pro aminopeptidase
VRPALAARFERARRLAADAGLDGLYVTAGPNFRWLTDQEPHPGGWPLWLSALLVPVDGEPAAVISRMHADIFGLEDFAVGQVFTYVDGQRPDRQLADAATAAGLARGRLGAEDTLWFGDVSLLSEVLPDATPVRAHEVFNHLRAVKDAEEIEHLRKAAAAHDIGYAAAREILRPGITIAAAAGEIVQAMLAAGSESLSMVGSFHHLSTRSLAPGEIVDVDLWPGSHGGYRADSARNMFLGEPSAKAQEMYAVTQRAYDAAMAAVRPGVTCESIHEACAAVMTDAGYEQVWKVGHGVGLNDIHEDPLLQIGNTTAVEQGMVFTIDPGAFIARDTPIHIEDTVLVTADGVESLNAYTRELIVIG